MPKDILRAILRVFIGTIIILALAATIGIPAGKRGPAAAQPGDEPRGLDLQAPEQDDFAPTDVVAADRRSKRRG